VSVRVRSAGVELHVELRGPEDGLPVVLLHAFPLSHRMWGPQLDSLSDRYRLVAPDSRGLGRSGVGDGQYTIELLVDDLLAVLDALELGGVVACGLSMGGYVLLRALERAPERFHAVVLADTRSQADDDAGKLARADSIRTLKAEGVEAFAGSFARRLLGPTTLARRPELAETVAGWIRESAALGICGAQLAMACRTDTTGALGALDVPALIVVGEEDALTPVAHSRSMAEAAKASKLVVLPGAGHLSNLEDPVGFDGALRAFLEEVEG
jgi:3-oxoadipate enol-lactonase